MPHMFGQLFAHSGTAIANITASAIDVCEPISAQASGWNTGIDVWWVVAFSVVVVLVAILVFRLHAFLTLLLAGLLVASLSSHASLDRYAQTQLASGKMTAKAAESFTAQSPQSRLATAFGETAGKIGILIALASIIGQCLLESGAASRIVDSILSMTGQRRAAEAIAASSFVIGIPVYFDTVFYLMVPLARSLRRKLGKDYVLFLMAIMAGGSIAHSLVPPTPGPLQVAEIIGVDIATMMIAGLAIGGCSSVFSLMAARIINHLVDVPLRSIDQGDSDASEDELSNVDRETPRPSLIASVLPIVVPVAMIGIGSVGGYFSEAGWIESAGVARSLEFLGDKNIAIAVGAALAMSLIRYCPDGQRKSLVNRSLSSAGNIILITAAGGAFGAMLYQAGIAQAVAELAGDVPGLLLLPLAFLVTTSIRTLQGSATIAMITAAGVLQGFANSDSLPFHPVYLAMAIGAGSKPISWMTDSGFWVITRMSGMTESEGLRVISPMSAAMGISALFFTILFAYCFPGIS
ncbi:hypothetical protein Rcae01_01523 [Novipirellula caenicola]|uniref:Inner membrane permease YgbN n=2 Tax=Novipirellula caenicola TaxID=1536901 RepID=A0ABP9VPG2_9BACT